MPTYCRRSLRHAGRALLRSRHAQELLHAPLGIHPEARFLYRRGGIANLRNLFGSKHIDNNTMLIASLKLQSIKAYKSHSY